MLKNATLTATCALLAGLVAFGSTGATADTYNPVINPAEFATKIDNPFFRMPIGKKMIFEKRSDEGLERIEITITGEKRKIMGVETFVYLDREFLNGELVEETKDYIAQDKDGNVWYFGEDVANYEDGKLKDHGGAWIAGVNGAKPGYWIKARHVVGDEYRQEFYKGEAEDMAKVVAVGLTVKTGLGTYENCTKTYDWTPLDPDSREHKYYCPSAGGLVLVEDINSGERVELKKVELTD